MFARQTECSRGHCSWRRISRLINGLTTIARAENAFPDSPDVPGSFNVARRTVSPNNKTLWSCGEWSFLARGEIRVHLGNP